MRLLPLLTCAGFLTVPLLGCSDGSMGPEGHRIVTNFEGARLAAFAERSEGNLDLILGRDADGFIRGWYSFRVRGSRGQPLNFRWLNQTANPDQRPVVSSDGGETWERVDEMADVGGLQAFHHTPRADDEWIAYQPVYSMTRWRDRLGEMEEHPFVTRVRVLTRSLGGRAVHHLEITDPGSPEEEKALVWLVGRQHPAETGGSWMLEGLMDWLLSDDPQARMLLQRAAFQIIPILNPDGVVRGDHRTNLMGLDLNRAWLSPHPERTPTIHAATQAMLASAEGDRPIVLLADFQTTGTGTSQILHNSAETTSPELYQEMQEFIALMEEINPEWSLSSSSGAPMGPERARGWGYFALNTHGMTAMAGSQAPTYGPHAGEFMTIPRTKALGEAFGKAVAQFFFDVPPS